MQFHRRAFHAKQVFCGKRLTTGQRLERVGPAAGDVFAFSAAQHDESLHHMAIGRREGARGNPSSMRAKSLRLRSARSSVVALVIPLLRVWHMAIDFQVAVSASQVEDSFGQIQQGARLLPVAAKTEKAIICCCGVRSSSSSYLPNASSNRAAYARAKAGVHSPESGASEMGSDGFQMIFTWVPPRGQRLRAASSANREDRDSCDAPRVRSSAKARMEKHP